MLDPALRTGRKATSHHRRCSFRDAFHIKHDVCRTGKDHHSGALAPNDLEVIGLTDLLITFSVRFLACLCEEYQAK